MTHTIRDQVAVNGTGSTKLIWVSGIPVGEHLLVHQHRGRWIVTHRPTGCAIDSMPDGRQARRLAARIMAQGYNIGEAYTTRAVEDIRGLAERERWRMAGEEVAHIRETENAE